MPKFIVHEPPYSCQNCDNETGKRQQIGSCIMILCDTCFKAISTKIAEKGWNY